MSSEWPVVRLGELVSVKHGFAFKGAFFSDSPTEDILVTPGNFAIGGGFKTDKLKFYDGPIPEEYELKPDDLVVTMTDLSKQADTLGYSALIPEHPTQRYLHNQRIGLVEIKSNELNKLYLYFLLRSREYRHHVVSSATGSTVKHTSPSKITSFEFRLPPLETQVNIGRVLKRLEDKIHLNQKIKQTLEQIAQVIFKSWFVDFEPVKAKTAALEAGGSDEDALLAAMKAISGKDEAQLTRLQTEQPAQYAKLRDTAELFPSAMQDSELGEIPEGWNISLTEELSEKIGMGPFGSNIRVSTFVDSGIPIISGQHLRETLVSDGENKFITKEHADKLKNSNVFPGDIIFTHAGTIGQVSLIPKEARYSRYVISQRQFYLRVDKKKASPNFMVYFFRSNLGQHLLLANASQVGVPSIARPSSHLKGIELVTPPLELMQCFEGVSKSLLSMTTLMRNQSQRLTAVRDTLLPKLLSGELSVSDAEGQAIEVEEAADV